MHVLYVLEVNAVLCHKSGIDIIIVILERVNPGLSFFRTQLLALWVLLFAAFIKPQHSLCRFLEIPRNNRKKQIQGFRCLILWVYACILHKHFKQDSYAEVGTYLVLLSAHCNALR